MIFFLIRKFSQSVLFCKNDIATMSRKLINPIFVNNFSLTGDCDPKFGDFKL